MESSEEEKVQKIKYVFKLGKDCTWEVIRGCDVTCFCFSVLQLLLGHRRGARLELGAFLHKSCV